MSLSNVSGFLAYLNKVWLTPYKEMFVYCWTDKFLNFGNHTTNRVESQHAKLKRYLDSSKLDLENAIKRIHQVIPSQVTSIKASIEQSKIVVRHRFIMPHFDELHGFVSSHALNIIFKEYERAKVVGLLAENCGCQLRTSHGLPCAHEQAMYLIKHQPIPLDSIDLFWKKLDLSPCISMKDDDIGCEAELEMLNAQFKKQSRSGKLSLLRKFMEIIAPSTTLVREPATHTATRGRPSLKTQSFRKTHVEQPPIPQERRRRSCSSASKFVHTDTVYGYQEPVRHSCYSSEPTRHGYYFHPYMNQFPDLLHPYITHLQDVAPDGNCGFRAIAACLNLHEDEWPSIRYNLMEELDMYKAEYVELYGIEQWYRIYNSLNFFELGRFAPNEYWMDMPETGVLIASRYNVILTFLTNAGCMTFLPLRSSPPPWYEHVAIAIGHVNGNHFVKISLAEGYPMPYIMPQWYRFKYDCATAWATPYMTRLNKYEQLLSRNRTTDFISLD